VLELFLREQGLAQFLVEGGIAAPDPFEHHGRVLLLLVAIVRQDRAQLGVLAGVDTLVVPVSTVSSSSISETIARCISRVASVSSPTASW
jgi:hypothetical protein